MAMGAITQTKIRETAVDFSYPYFMTNIGFITRKPSRVPKFLAIMWPYKNNAWVAFTITLVVFNLTTWMVSRVYKKEFSPNFNLGKMILHVNPTQVRKRELLEFFIF